MDIIVEHLVRRVSFPIDHLVGVDQMDILVFRREVFLRRAHNVPGRFPARRRGIARKRGYDEVEPAAEDIDEVAVELVQVGVIIRAVNRTVRILFALQPEDPGEVHFGIGIELGVDIVDQIAIQLAGIRIIIVERVEVVVYLGGIERLAVFGRDDADLIGAARIERILKGSGRKYPDRVALAGNDI